jgi:hypothetical protein
MSLQESELSIHEDIVNDSLLLPIGAVDEDTRQGRIKAHIMKRMEWNTLHFAPTEYVNRQTLRWNNDDDMELFIQACSTAINMRTRQISQVKKPLEYARGSLKEASTKFPGGGK